MAPQAACNHTMHLTDTAGKRIGSWIDEPYRGRVRVVCRHCRKFYGYRRDEIKNGQVVTPGRRESLQQQHLAEQSCPVLTEHSHEPDTSSKGGI